MSTINEGSTARYTCTFTDAAGAAINPMAVTDIRAWLRDPVSGTVVNGRDNQSVLNANGGTYSAGTFTLVLSAADTVSVGTREIQPRTLTLRITYTDGVITHEKAWSVRDLAAIAS